MFVLLNQVLVCDVSSTQYFKSGSLEQRQHFLARLHLTLHPRVYRGYPSEFDGIAFLFEFLGPY